ncbi:MAG: hypothetical protein A2W25_15485 [candidate division Zixibacteria bacterium RBG_16_53_22]|nr:MAG: hypothetical protein A2W25_15485 [candidate division Zixibacteria bacterium RBG_16_53_22]
MGESMVDGALAKLTRASKMLAEAKTLDDVLKIKDLAQAAETYARAAKLGLEAQNNAAEVTLRAERKAGEMIRRMKERGEIREGRKPKLSNDSIVSLDDLGISSYESSTYQRIEDLPDEEFESHIAETKASGRELTTSGTLKEAKAYGRQEEREEKTRAGESMPKSGESFRLIHSSIETLDIEPNSIDVIITDPPYPEEYLPLYEVLAERAAVWLKPGGSLVVMIGQSYLPAIVVMLGRHLTYNWTGAYLTPGKTYQAFDRKVLCGFKPLLWYAKGDYVGKWVYDVCKSDVPDKDSHEWGQSESGISNIIQQFTNEGDLILDPFCGGGTTIKCAVALGRRVIGAD